MRDWRIGELIGERFEVRGLLGHGSFGDVLAVLDRHATGSAPGTLKALKLMPRGGSPFEREIAAARRAAGQPRLLVAEQALQIGEWLALLMPCSRGCLLADWLQSNPAETARTRRLLQSLCELVATLHGLGVAHDDLGFGNVMVASDEAAELIDFGSSVCSEGPPAPPRLQANAFYGQRLHAAGFDAVRADDVRALAVLGVLALTHQHPFCDDWQGLLHGQRPGPDPFLGPARDSGLGGRLADALRCALGPAAGRPEAGELGAAFGAGNG